MGGEQQLNSGVVASGVAGSSGVAGRRGTGSSSVAEGVIGLVGGSGGDGRLRRRCRECCCGWRLNWKCQREQEFKEKRSVVSI